MDAAAGVGPREKSTTYTLLFNETVIVSGNSE